jgi:hypothetical protein
VRCSVADLPRAGSRLSSRVQSRLSNFARSLRGMVAIVESLVNRILESALKTTVSAIN